jgi:hypothetical protein
MRHHFLGTLIKRAVVDNAKVLLLLRLSGLFESPATPIGLGSQLIKHAVLLVSPILRAVLIL